MITRRMYVCDTPGAFGRPVDQKTMVVLSEPEEGDGDAHIPLGEPGCQTQLVRLATKGDIERGEWYETDASYDLLLAAKEAYVRLLVSKLAGGPHVHGNEPALAALQAAIAVSENRDPSEVRGFFEEIADKRYASELAASLRAQ